MMIDPQDDQDLHLHELFLSFRNQVVDVVDGFAGRVMERVERADMSAQKPPRITEVFSTGVVELLNMLYAVTAEPDLDKEE